MYDYDRAREEYENTLVPMTTDEEGLFSIDEYVEEIETEYNCKVEELADCDCIEIVEKYLAISVEDAHYDSFTDSILYTM